MNHVLLVGATDGIGLALARLFLERRSKVAIVGREPDKLQAVLEELRPASTPGSLCGIVCDVRDGGRAPDAFEEAIRQMGRLDWMVYCAGVRRTTQDPATVAYAAQETMDVNVVGAVQWCELAADYLTSVEKGAIAALGSVAGERGRKGNPAYNASKAALHIYMEGLRHRLHGTGVRVVTVKLGPVTTRVLGGRNSRLAIEVNQAARLIARGMDSRTEVFYVPRRWWLATKVLRMMPGFLFNRIGPP